MHHIVLFELYLNTGILFANHFNCFNMKALTLPIISKRYVETLGKTAIEFNLNGVLSTVFANGDQTSSNAVLVNLVVNEVGDSFIAGNDSKTMDDKGKPLFKKGQTVVRQKQSMEFKSFTGDNSAAQFAQSAFAFGLQLNVVMG